MPLFLVHLSAHVYVCVCMCVCVYMHSFMCVLGGEGGVGIVIECINVCGVWQGGGRGLGIVCVRFTFVYL